MKFFRLLLETDPFVLTSASFIGFGWTAFILALFGFFFPFLLGITLSCVALAVLLSLGLIIQSKDWLRFGLWVVLFLAVTSAVLSAEPSVFSGRDQGSIAEAAWRLAENHEFAFETPASRAFFNIYGPGTALNFPGFSYTDGGKLITQFPLGYTSFLAGFVSLFGLAGFQSANTVLLFLLLWGVYELLALFTPRHYALGGTALAFFSFLPMWISRYTLSENLAAFLFVFLAYSAVRLVREKKIMWYWISLGTAVLLAFTRIEGFAILLVFGVGIVLIRSLRSLVFSSFWRNIVIVKIIFLFLFLRDFFINLPFYKFIGKALFKITHEYSALGTLPDTAGSLGLGSIFFSYGLLILFLVGILGIVLVLSEKEYSFLIVLALASPTLVYLLIPSITPDHPWMLRRYYPTIYPLFIFFATSGIYLILRKPFFREFAKPLAGVFFLILFAFQGQAFLSGYRIHDAQGLTLQTQAFSERFNTDDLILIDRLTTSDPFTFISGPMSFLFGKQAVYFFNPNDLSRLDLSSFKKIYLLSPEESLALYSSNLIGEKLLPIETVTLSSKRLIPPSEIGAAPSEALVSTDSLLFEFMR